MTTKRIVYTRPDGGLDMMVPAIGARLVQVGPEGQRSVVRLDHLNPRARSLSDLPSALGAVWAETESEFALRLMLRHAPASAADAQVVDCADCPDEHLWAFEAWEIAAGRVKVNAAKCRDVKRRGLRQLRAPRLTQADVDMFRAIEGMLPQLKALGIDTSAAEAASAKKRALRDVTSDPGLDAAKTPAEIKAFMPAALVAEVSQ